MIKIIYEIIWIIQYGIQLKLKYFFDYKQIYKYSSISCILKNTWLR